LVSHKGLREFVISVAEEMNIPYRFDAMPGGGTDAGAIHMTMRGVPALTISIPTRYIHSHAALLHRDDYEQTVKLLVEVIRRLDEEKVKEITFD
ncbi:peptidase M28, partial [Geobacillus sp. LEMMJ02]